MFPTNEISQKDVYDFFRQFARNCTVCGRSEWKVTDIDRAAVELIAAKDGLEYVQDPHKIPCCACICDHCGYVNLHAIEPIYRWVKNQRKAHEA